MSNWKGIEAEARRAFGEALRQRETGTDYASLETLCLFARRCIAHGVLLGWKEMPDTTEESAHAFADAIERGEVEI